MVSNIPKIIFIVPYRNRENDLTHFRVYMKYILEDILITDYEIYFSYQNDERAFNRGATKNIGFLAMREKYPDHYRDITFVFNDIDILPYKKNMLNYTTEIGIVKHFYGFNFALGGIFSITGADFETVKGFPNFWGWGWEDDVINNRCIENDIKIDRTSFYPIAHPDFIQTSMQRNKLLSDQRPDVNRCRDDNIDTLKNVKYSMVTYNDNDNILNNQLSDCWCHNSAIIKIDNFNTIRQYTPNRFYIQDLVKNRVIVNDRSKISAHKLRWSLSR